MKARCAALVTIFVLMLLLAACGGTSSSRTPAAPAPTTPTPSPTPTPPAPTPTPTPPAPTPSPSVSPTSYQAGIINGTNSATAQDLGKLSIDAGKVTYQFSGWQANMPFTIDFCNYPVLKPDQCFALNTGGTTDANGAASGSFQFPQSGRFFGWFRFNANTLSVGILSSGFTPTFTGGQEYAAAMMVRIVEPPLIQEPFGTGSVTVNNANIHIQVNGAPANASYTVFESNSINGEDQIGTLLTDASGNGAVDLHNAQAHGLVVLVRNGGGEVLSGFQAP